MKITQTKASEILMAESLAGRFIYFFLTGFTVRTMGTRSVSRRLEKCSPVAPAATNTGP